MGLLLSLSALCGLLILSLPAVSEWLASTLEKPYQTPFNPALVQDRQAIVVIGSGLRDNRYEFGASTTVSHRTLERLRYGALLAKLTDLPLLVAGGRVFDPDKPSEAEIMADILEKEFQIAVRWQENRSRNTAENALYSYRLLQSDHIDRIILVTHAFHMRRALIEFSKAGFNVVAAPTGFFSSPEEHDLLDYIPSASAFLTSNLVMHEYLGRLWYWLRY